MGRLTARIATAFAAADNVAYEDTMKDVSALDALTSSKLVKWLLPEANKTKDASAEQRHDRLFKVKTDSKGRKALVVHKGKKVNVLAKGDKADQNDQKTEKQNDKKNKPDHKKDATKVDGEKNDAKPNADANHGKAWTAEEDEKLKSMKADTKTWKEITEALGRGKSELQARFKELTAQSEAAKESNDGKKKADKKGQANDKQPDDAKGKNKNKQNRAAEKNAEQARDEVEEARFTMQEWIALQEDGLFSLGELQCLSELYAQHGDENWLGIASGFYDITGRRVSPDDIRDKFTQMSAMLED